MPMSEGNGGGNMICPKCGEFQEKAEVCKKCGVIIAKVRPEKKPEAETAEDTEDNAEAVQAIESVETAPMPLIGKVISVVIGVGILTGFFFIITPVDMTIDELSAAKKGSFHLRKFRVEGTVETYASWLRAQSGDGEDMSSFKIVSGDSDAYITYDPRRHGYTPQDGDRVRVTGNIESVPYFDGSTTPQTLTISIATAIDVIE